MRFVKILKVFLAILSLFIGAILITLYHFNDYKIYNYPHSENGVMDFSGYTYTNKNVNVQPVGNVEFYYNRWIISDNDNEPLDSYLKVPSKWSSTLFNDDYSKKGYASYKVTLKNLEPNTEIQIYLNNVMVASNFYINNELVGVVGSPSKDKMDTYSNLRNRESKEYIVPEDGTIEFVIETGLNDCGGLSAMPALIFECHDEAYNNIIGALPSFALGLAIFSMIISIFLSKTQYGNKKYNIFIILELLVLHFIFSNESLIQYRNYGIYGNELLFQYASFFTICLFTFYLYIFISKIKSLKTPKYLLILYVSILIILNIIYPFVLATIGVFIIWIIFFIVNILIIVRLMIVVYRDKDLALIYIYFLVIGLGLVEMLDYTDVVNINSWGFVSVYMIAVMAITFIYYGLRINGLNKIEMEKQQIEIEKLNLTQEVLVNQIQPHFIHNSLNNIMYLYHKDLYEGDKGLILFSKHLRNYVDLVEDGLIEFDCEIDSIVNYVEFVNLSLEDKFNLLLDIEYSNFKVPALSIQPIVENAIKYSRVNEKEDGYIKISSKIENEYIIVSVSNNGVSFNVNDATKKSKGIKNIKERFKISLGAEMLVRSDEVTEFIIKIKL